MMQVRFSLLRVLCLITSLAAAPAASAAPVSLVYRQITGNKEDRIEISEQALPSGEDLGVAISSGESYRITSDASGGVTACSFEFPQEGTSWTAVREGSTLRLEGTVRHRPVSRSMRIDGNPWYESVERSLQSYSISNPLEPVRFWMIEPYTASVYLMAGRIERREAAEVDGRSVDAIRVVVRPDGVLAFIWKSTYWFDPNDGTFLRSKSVRGFLAVVPTVIELTEDRRPGR
jgi:hypothetical protein